ncbi:U-scoloptoxin(05)-Er3a-like [Ptychodera flava]|uniref:U-scoloptoxin(05)-Er3a-like n=1 Tax=Ptychodera flava TaxID=63121 RepID=UPI00396A8E23
MKLLWLTFVAFLVVVLEFKRVDSINCLQCVGVGYNDCGGKWGKEKKMKALPCLNPEHNWCFVMREDDNEGKITNSAYERGCSKESLGNFCNVGETMSTCYSSCNTDGCNRDNSASGLQFSVLAVIMTFGIALLFY